MSFFNYVVAQDSKIFVSNNLIQNDFLFKNVVVGKVSALSLNKQFSNVRYELTDDNRVITRDGSKDIPVTFMSFLMENSPFGPKVLDDKEAEDIRKTECTASVDCNRILERKKQAKILTWINTEGNPYGNLAIRDNPTQDLNYTDFKILMKAFYSEKISDLESKKTDKQLTNLPFIGNLGKNFQEYNRYLIPAAIALFIFAILSIFKFIIHTLISVVMWIVWKFLVLVGFVQIEVELVESEIVSI